MLSVPAPWPHGLTSPDVGSSVNLALGFRPYPVRLSMDHQASNALALRSAAVRAEMSALSAASVQIRADSSDAIRTAKAILEHSRIELARLRVTRAVALTICLPDADSDAALSSLDR